MDREPIDAAILTDLQETAGDDFVADLVTTFLDEAPLLLETLRQSVFNSPGPNGPDPSSTGESK